MATVRNQHKEELDEHEDTSEKAISKCDQMVHLSAWGVLDGILKYIYYACVLCVWERVIYMCTSMSFTCVWVLVVVIFISAEKMQGEIEFLQAAFESYKSQLHLEMDEKWKKRQDDLQLQHKEDMQSKIHQLSE